jgi:cytidyltransferase-like protein
MIDSGKTIIVSGSFDDVRSRDVRFLQEASRLGKLHVHLWLNSGSQLSKFSLAERKYFLESVRFVGRVFVEDTPSFPTQNHGDVWVDVEGEFNQARREHCQQCGLDYRVLGKEQLGGFPELPGNAPVPGRKKVIVTGSFDWFHSGHVRFFEEASALGNLYVIVGHDANIRLLKGAQHPLLPQAERLYMATSIRFVTEAMISTGSGWLDAEPEILRLKPDIYVVNEDGDKGGKREYCETAGIEYVVLKRKSAPGLTSRSSTDLRGF